MQSTLKDINLKRYMQIKEEHGNNYVRAYHEALAEVNGLEGSLIYAKLKPYQKTTGENFVVAVMDSKFHCVHVGYTECPFTYWVNLLKENKYGTIKDLIILAEGLDNKVALRMAKELKKNLLKLTREFKISIALG